MIAKRFEILLYSSNYNKSHSFAHLTLLACQAKKSSSRRSRLLISKTQTGDCSAKKVLIVVGILVLTSESILPVSHENDCAVPFYF